MGSRSKRRAERNKRQRRSSPQGQAFDVHAQTLVDSVASLTALMGTFAATADPGIAVGKAFDDAVTDLVAKVRPFDVAQLVEVARQRFLPMGPEGAMPVVAEASAAYVELLALVGLAARAETTTAGELPEPDMNSFMSEAKGKLDRVLHLAQLRSFAAVDTTDKLAKVSMLIRSAEVWMRNSSYPEMVAATNLALLDGNARVRAALNDQLGFDATDALAVLDACHRLQEANMNDRFDAVRDALSKVMAAEGDEQASQDAKERARPSVMSMFKPAAVQVTVAVADIAAETGIAVPRVQAVVERFRLDLGAATPADVIEDFTNGKNPLRIRPLIVSENRRVMLPHPALNVFALRENLEEQLKTSQPAWNEYAKYRGEVLESRTRAALNRVLPGSHVRDAFEYYLPVSDAEAQAADPAKYTKRVEGDHLFVIDDIAIIVEDKAVAFSALSRGGKTTRIRTDLTGIITKAAEQSGRMRDAIERDGGLRIEGEGWVDFSNIREIHTIAVSLDDISSVLTATAELVRAGLLSKDNIPWTVSLHDLELITELIERPAEFLFYLRRRRDPDATVFFQAPDELDLFLHFFEAGLWVEPDPAAVRAAFPFLPAPSTAELRRHRARQPVFLTSRTDELDQWFYAKQHGGTGSGPGSPAKPAMVPSPFAPLIDELRSRKINGWLSIGATLLSMGTDAQRKLAHDSAQLLDSPLPNGQGRSLTVPVTSTTDPTAGWLFVWATLPAGQYPSSAEASLRSYVRAKKHQLKLPRGVVFLYDELTRDLAGAFYDGHAGPLDAEATAALQYLQPPTTLQRTIHPNAKRPSRTEQDAAQRKKKR